MSSPTPTFLSSTESHPNRLYILFPHKLEQQQQNDADDNDNNNNTTTTSISPDIKQQFQQQIDSLNRKYRHNKGEILLQVVFGDEMPLSQLEPDDLDEEGYIWVCQNGDILTEYQLEKDDIEEEISDIELWIMSQVMTLQHMSMFQDIEIPEEEEDQEDDGEDREDNFIETEDSKRDAQRTVQKDEEDSEDDAKALARKLVLGAKGNSQQDEDEDDDDDEDADFVPKDNATDDEDYEVGEDDNDEQDVTMSMMEQLEKLKNLHLDEDKNLITQQEVQELWIEYGQQLGRNTLAFTAFKDSMTKYVSQLLFTRNPVMKMMNQFTDPAAADQDDLDTLVEEVSEPSFNERNVELTDSYPQSVLKHRAAVQERVTSSGKKWSDDHEYLVENLEGASEDEEDANDDNDSQQGETTDLDDYTVADKEWMIAGPEIQRIQIGAFAVSRKWKGQFRFKVDNVNEAILYHLFEFVPSPIPREMESQKYHKDFFKRYMQEQLDRFRESRVFRVWIPLDTLHRIQYHESRVEASLCLTVLQVNEPPQFFSRFVKDLNSADEEWKSCEDFSANAQLSQFATHYLVGYAREWNPTLTFLFSHSKDAKDLYKSDLDYDAIESDAENPNFDLPDEMQNVEPSNDTPFEGDEDAEDETEEGCVVM